MSVYVFSFFPFMIVHAGRISKIHYDLRKIIFTDDFLSLAEGTFWQCHVCTAVLYIHTVHNA